MHSRGNNNKKETIIEWKKIMNIVKFEKLDCWQNARAIAQIIYTLTAQNQFKKDYSLIFQMRKAAISVMANIAEGYGRRGDKEFRQFLSIAKSSATELQSHLYIALDQKYIDKTQFDDQYNRLDIIQRQICNLIKYLSS